MSFGWLPKVLAEIAEAAGLEAALQLAAARGGTEIYVPARAGDDHWLVLCVGREAADAICRHFSTGRGGGLVELPLGPAGSLAKIRRRVDAMIAEGRSNTEIALACGYTVRGVSRRRRGSARRRKQDTAQRELL